MGLYKYQKEAVKWLQDHPKTILAMEQGTGKTVVAIEYLKNQKLENADVGPTIVVCPASLTTMWRDQINHWTGGLLKPIIFKNNYGSYTRLTVGTADVIIVSYEMASTLYQLTGIYLKSVPNCIIVDEAHYVKNPQAKRTKALAKLIKGVPNLFLLTGTPIVNKPIDLWIQLAMIGATKLTYHEFGLKFCAGWLTPYGPKGSKVWDYSGLSNPKLLNSILAQNMFRVEKKDVLKDLPPKVYKVVEFGVEDKNYSLESIEAPEHSIPFEAISDMQKFNVDLKFDECVEFIEKKMKKDKVVIFVKHTLIKERLREAFKHYNPVTFSGKENDIQKAAAVDKFQNDKSCSVFIGNIQAAGTGITLTAAHKVFFVESSWSPSEIQQCVDRCHRIGQNSRVEIYFLTTAKSIDSQMIRTVLKKMDVIGEVI